MVIKIDDVVYRHAIIQFATSLLKRFFLNTVVIQREFYEPAIYAILFGVSNGLSSQELIPVLEKIGDSRNEIVNMVRKEVDSLLKTKGYSLGKSFKSGLKEFLENKYTGDIDDSKEKTLLGDIFLLHLFETAAVIINGESQILDSNLFSKLKDKKRNKTLVYVCNLLSNNWDTALDSWRNSLNEQESYSRMTAAMSLYVTYTELMSHKAILDMEKKTSSVEVLEVHLNFLKESSTDIYEP